MPPWRAGVHPQGRRGGTGPRREPTRRGHGRPYGSTTRDGTTAGPAWGWSRHGRLAGDSAAGWRPMAPGDLHRAHTVAESGAAGLTGTVEPVEGGAASVAHETGRILWVTTFSGEHGMAPDRHVSAHDRAWRGRRCEPCGGAP